MNDQRIADDALAFVMLLVLVALLGFVFLIIYGVVEALT